MWPKPIWTGPFNRWGDTPTSTQQHSAISLENLTTENQKLKLVHFNPANAPADAVTDTLSVSISQLEIGDGDDHDHDMLETNPTTTPSLAEALEGTSTITLSDKIPTSESSKTPLELPYLAEVMWKQARGATRAGIKARTYARHTSI